MKLINPSLPLRSVKIGTEMDSDAWLDDWVLIFVVAGMKFANKQLDVTLEGVLGTTMSSTGFVTFLDLASTTCAASAPLTVKAHALGVSIAPEPREILWENARMSKPTQLRREGFVNFLCF